MNVRRAKTADERDDALAVRREVFIDEQGVPEHLELDGRDDDAVQFVAYADDEPVGAARLREYDESTGKVERVAVVENRRETGLGGELMAEVEATSVDEGFDRLVLHAQVPVVGFYERLGYEVTSEVFEDAGIPHREMRKRL